MRAISALVVASALVLSLAACSTPSPADRLAGDLASCDSSVNPGTSSDLVRATGKGEPKVDYPAPLVTKRVERSVITQGEGRVLRSGDIAEFQLVQYDGTTADTFIGSSWEEAPSMITVGTGESLLAPLFECVPVGSRIAGVIPASLISAEAPKGATAVVVVDVVEGFASKSEGSPQLPDNGMPNVVLSESGQPGVVIPKSDPPTDLRISTLKAGSGAKIKKGDTVVVNYTGLLWKERTIFDSSWDKGTPARFVAQSSADAAGGLVPGFAKALIGAKVGDQILVVIPPKFGYESGTAPETIPDGSTMVFVIDILHIAD
ncbi:hypothetical protein EYE40_03880 [Glaciihabitans arcticus]|uniref:Peptidyl-prolyl cis-trans isomerase n=1 Tax=Glaciihabitans arcticus TaxID=2668039 RepID=A0A4Q9GPR1_9MICO|nr:FKBP-type peptidyl-prolyl cis-trans isomerase [Glaciihabitans arcticus]TBN56605.1 hypothetical protein EYE40_03880 [Glaciihabitans arcticus]